MRLPVDSVDLWLTTEKIQAAAEEFFKSTGPLYRIIITYTHSPLKPSTVDAMIKKFVPVNFGRFILLQRTRLTKDQLEKLILKCEMSRKPLMVMVRPEGVTSNSKVTDFFNFDKHYSKKVVKEGVVTANREGAKLESLVKVKRGAVTASRKEAELELRVNFRNGDVLCCSWM
uniref:Brix domain-containing protein n=1 Tax=Steinernema glaseri TaxID=37863 RepID=A0A1I7YCU3_9BILA